MSLLVSCLLRPRQWTLLSVLAHAQQRLTPARARAGELARLCSGDGPGQHVLLTVPFTAISVPHTCLSSCRLEQFKAEGISRRAVGGGQAAATTWAQPRSALGAGRMRREHLPADVPTGLGGQSPEDPGFGANSSLTPLSLPRARRPQGAQWNPRDELAEVHYFPFKNGLLQPGEDVEGS